MRELFLFSQKNTPPHQLQIQTPNACPQPPVSPLAKTKTLLRKSCLRWLGTVGPELGAVLLNVLPCRVWTWVSQSTGRHATNGTILACRSFLSFFLSSLTCFIFYISFFLSFLVVSIFQFSFLFLFFWIHELYRARVSCFLSYSHDVIVSQKVDTWGRLQKLCGWSSFNQLQRMCLVRRNNVLGRLFEIIMRPLTLTLFSTEKNCCFSLILCI